MSPSSALTPSQIAALLGSTGCPSPDRIFAAVCGELEPKASEAILAHAALCDACSAELLLARSFAAPAPAQADGASASSEAADVAWIVGELARRRETSEVTSASPMGEPLARVLPMRSRSPRQRTGTWLAAAASVLLASGALYVATRTAAPPTLPPPPATDVLRSGEISWVTSPGSVHVLPADLAWSRVPNAARYRLTAQNAATRAQLWSGESDSERLAMPAALGAQIVPWTAVELQVEALAADGSRLALSPPLTLRLEP